MLQHGHQTWANDISSICEHGLDADGIDLHTLHTFMACIVQVFQLRGQMEQLEKTHLVLEADNNLFEDA